LQRIEPSASGFAVGRLAERALPSVAVKDLLLVQSGSPRGAANVQTPTMSDKPAATYAIRLPIGSFVETEASGKHQC
jgi:hypothetical protein